MSGKWTMLLLAGALIAQSPAPFRSQSNSTIDFSVKADTKTEVTGSGIPGRPLGEKMVLRKSVHTKEVVDEVGMEVSTTIEAWPLGRNLTSPPLYKISVKGADPRVANNEVIVVARGVEDVEWWSIYGLGGGKPLFDTHVPLAQASITKDVRTLRYAGAAILRSYFDTTRSLSMTPTGIKVTINPISISVPLRADALDLARAVKPVGLALSPRKR